MNNPSGYTEADFEFAYQFHTRLCYIAGAAFFGGAVAILFRGTEIFGWILGG